MHPPAFSHCCSWAPTSAARQSARRWRVCCARWLPRSKQLLAAASAAAVKQQPWRAEGRRRPACSGARPAPPPLPSSPCSSIPFPGDVTQHPATRILPSCGMWAHGKVLQMFLLLCGVAWVFAAVEFWVKWRGCQKNGRGQWSGGREEREKGPGAAGLSHGTGRQCGCSTKGMGACGCWGGGKGFAGKE
jgi:hypothetical protein